MVATTEIVLGPRWRFWRARQEPPKALWERAMVTFERPYRRPRPALVLVKSLVVEAPTFFYARHGARLVLGTDDLLHGEASEGNVAIDVQLRFEGDDYARGGTPDGKRLQMRRRIGNDWTGWEDI